MALPTSPISSFVQVAGLRTHALIWGELQSPPLVIVPGLGCAAWMYWRLARELARERRVYIYDPPGHGYSEGRWNYPADIPDLIEHLSAWLQVMGLRGTPLLGHSLGGEVILALAANDPQITCALIACAPTGIPENPSVPVQFFRLLLDLPRERPGLLGLGFRAYSVAGSRRMFLLARSQSHHHTGEQLARIRVPTLLLDGDRDPVIRRWTVETIQREVPHSLVMTVPQGTHALTDSHPRTVARMTLDFLRLIKQEPQDWTEELEKKNLAQ